MNFLDFKEGSEALSYFQGVIKTLEDSFNGFSGAEKLLKRYGIDFDEYQLWRVCLTKGSTVIFNSTLITVKKLINVTLQLLAIKLIKELFNEQKKNRKEFDNVLKQKEGCVTYNHLQSLIDKRDLIGKEIEATKKAYDYVVSAAKYYKCLMFNEEGNRYSFYYVVDLFSLNSSFYNFIKKEK